MSFVCFFLTNGLEVNRNKAVVQCHGNSWPEYSRKHELSLVPREK